MVEVYIQKAQIIFEIFVVLESLPVLLIIPVTVTNNVQWLSENEEKSNFDTMLPWTY